MEEDFSRQQMMELVDRQCELANSGDLHRTRCLHELVRDHPDFEVLCEPTVHQYHFRYVPHPLAEHQDELEIQKLLDRLNEEIVESLQRVGLNSVMTTRVQGRIAIQILNGSSTSDIGATFEAIARWGRLVNIKRSVSKQAPDMEAQLCLSESHSSPTEASAT